MDPGSRYDGPVRPELPERGPSGPSWWRTLKVWLSWLVIVVVMTFASGMFVYDAVHDNMVDGPECTYWRFMTLQCL